ncbi:hypothetical protein UlMin_032557 [Ulmus minor]
MRVPHATFLEHAHRWNTFDKESIEFQYKVLERSGIGDEACVPAAKLEIEEVLFPIVEDLLTKQKINPKSIDILVTNCSLFSPTPSISSMIINKFGLRRNVKSFSLSGMGCSAGILSISLAEELLKVHKNSTALVLSMEAVSPNGYHGKVKSMLVSNVLFRMGGAAILLSNKRNDKKKAKYKLKHLVRTHMGFDDQAYKSVFQQSDEIGLTGVSLSKALLKVAAKALTANMSTLGPLVLPYSEQLRYAWSLLGRKIRGGTGIYVPNFKKAFEHFCIHAGGRAVIDALEENLKLDKLDAEASRMTLYRFGNTSSSSVWYELCYLEAKGRMKKGDRVWKIALGSGFKCDSAVWECISDIDPNEINAWSDRINLYPVEIPNMS